MIVVDDPSIDDQLPEELASLLDPDKLVFGTATPEIDDQVVGESVQWVIYDVKDGDGNFEENLVDLLAGEADKIDEAASTFDVDGTTYRYYQLEGEANLKDAAVAIGSPAEGVVLVVSVGGVADGDAAKTVVEDAVRAVPTV